jgi:protease I
VDIASLGPGRIAGEHGELLLPGGQAPNRSSKSPAVLGVVRAFFRAKKPVFAICHGPQILISAGVLRDLPTFLREV